MAVFVSLEIDDFQRTFNQQANNSRAGRRGGDSPPVRRPTRGLEINDDTYAIMRVVRSDGSQIPLFDSGSLDGSGKSNDYANFLLQGVSEARMEKQQIVETFGEPYIYFFGEAPRFIDVQAILLNSFDFNWKAEWWENYNTYLRGTRLVEMNARCYLFYEDTIIEGYMLNAQTQAAADNPLFLQLQFRMFVTNYTNISFIGDPFYPIRSGAVPPPGVADLTTMDAWDQLTPKTPEQVDPQAQAQEMFLQALRSSGQAQVQQQAQMAQNLESAISAEQQIAATRALIASGSPFSTAYLSNVLRSGMTSAAFPAQNIEGFLFNVQQFLNNAQASIAPNPELQHLLPMRSKISDNKDEYISGGAAAVLPAAWKPGANGTAPGTDPTVTPGGPIGSPPISPLSTLDQQAQARGAQMGPASLYGFGLVPYAPGYGQQSYGAYGRPLGGGLSPTGGGVAGVFVGAGGVGSGVGGTIGTPFAAGAGARAVAGAYAGQVPFGSNTGLGGAPPGVAGLILSNSSFASQGGYPGSGVGYRANYSRSYGYTGGVGGSFGGAMGGSFGPGVGGGLGGYGGASYGNPAFPQYGNGLQQQYAQSPYGLPSGSPYGLGYSAPGSPTTAPVYRFTAGIRPDGTLQTSRGVSPMGVPGVTTFGGFGSRMGGQTGIFGGGANMAAVAAMGAGIRGDGAFGMQALPGIFAGSL